MGETPYKSRKMRLHPVGGGGGTLLYKSYRYVPPQRASFLCRLCLKTDIEFTHFGLESVMVFAGTTEYTNVFVVSIPSKKRKKKIKMRIRNGP